MRTAGDLGKDDGDMGAWLVDIDVGRVMIRELEAAAGVRCYM